MNTADLPTIDINHLDILRQAIGDDFKQLIPSYLEQTDQLIDQLNQSSAQPDLDFVIRSANSLRSSSYDLGAFKLSEYSRQLEESPNDDSFQQSLEPLIELINNEYPHVREELIAYQAKYR